MKKYYSLLILFVVLIVAQVNSQTTTFNYTGAVQTYTVGTCVYSISVDAAGAEGMASVGGCMGGKGGRVQATMTVTPGQVLNIYVGQRPGSNTGGWNGGGAGGTNGGGGGGASDIRIGGTALSNRVIVAGGGGGGAQLVASSGYDGGNGGGLIAANGYYSNGQTGQQCGKGGTQTAGGAGGTSTMTGGNGSSGTGGGGGESHGGGGGAGYYGGGGGASYGNGGAGGGGGSSYTASGVTGVTHTQGYRSGNGIVIITPIVSSGPATPGSIMGQAAVCKNASGTYSIASVSTATSYTWTVPAGAVINSGQGTTTVNVTFGSTPGNLSVAAVNACGTGTPQSMAITISEPVADAGADEYICQGGSVQLMASGGIAYSWMPATGLSNANISNPTANPAASANYTLTVTDAAGCTAVDEMTVTVNPLPQANAGADVSICSGDSTQLSASGGNNYSWNTASGLSSANIANPVASPASTITYTVVVTDGFGCSASDDVTITVNAIPFIDPGSDVTICKGYTTPLNSGDAGGNTYLWAPAAGLTNPNISDPVASNTITTTYTVTVTNTDGCSSQGDVMVFVDLCNGVVNNSQDVVLEMFPNPSAGDLFIESLRGSITGLEILDLDGKVVLKDRISVLQHAKIDLSMLQRGVYVIKIHLDEEVVIKKIIRE